MNVQTVYSPYIQYQLQCHTDCLVSLAWQLHRNHCQSVTQYYPTRGVSSHPCPVTTARVLYMTPVTIYTVCPCRIVVASTGVLNKIYRISIPNFCFRLRTFASWILYQGSVNGLASGVKVSTPTLNLPSDSVGYAIAFIQPV